MNYEQRLDLISRCKPEYKDILLARLLKGETIDITKDADLFFQINADRMPMEDFMKQDKFKSVADVVKTQRAGLHDARTGASKDRKMRWMGDIPASIWLTHPWFKATLDKKERDANIKKWFRLFPAFRGGEKE